MRITAVETIRPAIQPNLLFVRLHTDDGRIGLGEAFFGGRTMESYLHESVADGLAVIEAIRSEVGLEMALMVELHGLWDRRSKPGAVGNFLRRS